ncbi:polysaccharide deacetylase family protein [Coprococcus sp. CLA-AA-H190]|uniref:Polysaccharide deacetylase family protein n=1 Tax=Coprococcus intestinihominis TaxID=3133154 RepID=A0ABV1B2N4_9FIRM
MIKNKRLLLIILIIFILAAAGSFFILFVDQWHIEINDGSENNVKIEYGDTYDDGTVTAALKGRYLLKKGFPVTVTSEGSVNTSKLGSYTINYHASFLFWKGADSKTLTVEDTVPPEIKLTINADHYTLPGHPYEEEGYTASDNVDGDLTDKVSVDGSVNTYSAGTYSLTYKVQDNYGNEAAVTRTVTVEPIRQADTVNPSGKIVYLTFDDGPGEYTSKLLDILSKYNVKATFFTVGSGHPDLLKAEADAGHSIGIHSATHDYSKIYASEDAFFADLRKQQDTIENATGIRTTLVRFPGGSSNTVSKSYCSGIMTKLTKDLTDMGYQYFDWNVTSGDAGETTSTSVVVQNVISGIQQHDVSIVLQHDIKGFSVNAVEQIIQWGLAHGYTFLPLTAESPTAHHGVNN